MFLVRGAIAALLLCSGQIWANQNIEHTKFTLGLSQKNNAIVVRLKNEKAIVQYILEVYINALELDSPDSQLGGSLCIRINRAGGRYIAGCLLCQPGAVSTFRPEECLGVFSQAMLDQAFRKAKSGTPIMFAGHGMRVLATIKALNYTSDKLLGLNDLRVDHLTLELEFIPDPSIPMAKSFTRSPL